jgi:hypothetical protein
MLWQYLEINYNLPLLLLLLHFLIPFKFTERNRPLIS